MKHTPYGYEIIGGKAVINEEQAEIIRKLCENYLSGMSFKGAAKAVEQDRLCRIKDILGMIFTRLF